VLAAGALTLASRDVMGQQHEGAAPHAATEPNEGASGAAREGETHGDASRERAGRSEDVEEEYAEYRFHMSFAGNVLWRLGEEPEPNILTGGGASLNVTVVPNHFEIELVATALLADHGFGFEVPIDLLAVFPFEVNHNLALYLGVGPTISPFQTREQSGLLFGVATATGFDYLVQRRGGFFVEFNYNLLFNSEGRIFHDVGFAAGPTFGF
jgi:hypothetical protein